MNNRNLFFSISLVFYSSTASAQFNTICKNRNVISLNTIEKADSSRLTEHTTKQFEHVRDTTIQDCRKQSKEKTDSINTNNLITLPLDRIRITSNYGTRKDPITGRRRKHYGIDLAAKSDNVKSIMPGKITKIGYEKKGLGNYVKVKHGDFETIYGHLHTSIGTEGDIVNAGTVVGLSGSTGRSTGEHLHFSVKFKNNYVDPKPILEYIIGIKKTKSGK